MLRLNSGGFCLLFILPELYRHLLVVFTTKCPGLKLAHFINIANALRFVQWKTL